MAEPAGLQAPRYGDDQSADVLLAAFAGAAKIRIFRSPSERTLGLAFGDLARV